MCSISPDSYNVNYLNNECSDHKKINTGALSLSLGPYLEISIFSFSVLFLFPDPSQ